MSIAFLGLGRMGSILAGHLVEAGHDLTVWNRSPHAAQRFGAEAAGRARVAETASDAVASAEIVFTALFGPDAVRDAVLGGELRWRPDALWIDITTIAPADATEFAAWAGGNGIRYVHSPVIGSLSPARNRQLGVLLGGEPDATSRARGLVELWADPDRFWTFDEPGKAAAAKLVANLALAVSMQGLVESLRLGHAGGLTTEETLATLDKTGLAFIAAMKGGNVRSGDYGDTQFSADLLAKDARLMAQTAALPLPALHAAFASLENAKRSGLGGDDFSVIARDDA
jgi:3-hydroxyisobutyrate dehydrogenase